LQLVTLEMLQYCVTETRNGWGNSVQRNVLVIVIYFTASSYFSARSNSQLRLPQSVSRNRQASLSLLQSTVNDNHQIIATVTAAEFWHNSTATVGFFPLEGETRSQSAPSTSISWLRIRSLIVRPLQLLLLGQAA